MPYATQFLHGQMTLAECGWLEHQLQRASDSAILKEYQPPRLEAVGTPGDLLKQVVSEKLKGRGLDVEFVAWLEGEEPRVPDITRIHPIRDADFAAAIR